MKRWILLVFTIAASCFNGMAQIHPVEKVIAKLGNWLTERDNQAILEYGEELFALNNGIKLPDRNGDAEEGEITATLFNFDNDTELIEFFHEHGIDDPFIIDHIVLTSYYRKIDNRDLDIEGQLEEWKRKSQEREEEYGKKPE